MDGWAMQTDKEKKRQPPKERERWRLLHRQSRFHHTHHGRPLARRTPGMLQGARTKEGGSKGEVHARVAVPLLSAASLSAPLHIPSFSPNPHARPSIRPFPCPFLCKERETRRDVHVTAGGSLALSSCSPALLNHHHPLVFHSSLLSISSFLMSLPL